MKRLLLLGIFCLAACGPSENEMLYRRALAQGMQPVPVHSSPMPVYQPRPFQPMLGTAEPSGPQPFHVNYPNGGSQYFTPSGDHYWASNPNGTITTLIPQNSGGFYRTTTP